MINSLNIGKEIYSICNSISDLGGRIYPLIAENGTDFPFVVYQRSGVDPEFCKDGQYQDVVGIEIKVVAATYHQGIAIAQQLREKLSVTDKASADNTMMYTSLLSGAMESYESDSYIQTLDFQLIINNKN